MSQSAFQQGLVLRHFRQTTEPARYSWPSPRADLLSPLVGRDFTECDTHIQLFNVVPPLPSLPSPLAVYQKVVDWRINASTEKSAQVIYVT